MYLSCSLLMSTIFFYFHRAVAFSLCLLSILLCILLIGTVFLHFHPTVAFFLCQLGFLLQENISVFLTLLQHAELQDVHFILKILK